MRFIRCLPSVECCNPALTEFFLQRINKDIGIKEDKFILYYLGQIYCS